MAPKDLIIDGAKFVPNNYAAIFDHAEAPSELHFVQDLLAHSEVGYALTQPELFSSQQVLRFWRTGVFDDGEESELRGLMTDLGYEKSLTKLGQLKRANIRREWSFFFDCITKAFGNKCSNFDAIPIMSQHIGYAIINQTHFDFATALIGFIGDRMTEDRDVVYFARFCQLIYTYCTDEPQLVSTQTPPFKVAKRYFNDLVNADTKKKMVRSLQIPKSVKQILVNADPDTYRSIYSDVQPPPTTQNPSTSVPTSHSTQPTLRTYLKSYLSTSQNAQPSSSAPTVKPTSSKPKRTKTVPQTPQKRRRITLRDESDSEDQIPSSEPVVDEAEKVTSQKDSAIGGSRLLKRLRRMTVPETPKESKSTRKYKKQRAQRPVSDDEEEAAKEGDQESLISQDKEFAPVTSSPSTPSQEPVSDKANSPSVSLVDPGTSAEIDIQNLVVPEILFLEAPTANNPSITPVTDAVQTPELSLTPSLHQDADDQILGEHQDMAVDQNLVSDQQLEDAEASIATHTVVLSEDTDSLSSDAANVGDTGEAATTVDADEAGPSGHTPPLTLPKSELVKEFVIRDAPVPWSETPAGQEWTKEWNSVSCVPNALHLAEHLTKADEMLHYDDFKTQLRVTALSTKHLQGLHSNTHAELHKIQENFIKQEQVCKIDKKKFFHPTIDRVAYIEKTQEKQQAQIDQILTNQASQQSQLTEIQTSVELLISLLLPADAKKGEKVIKSKCKTNKTLQGKDDGKDDQGNSGMGSGHSQGRRFTSRQASHRTSSDTGKRISSAAGKRISSDELLDLDEEMSRQLFLQENPGMDLESLKEEEARLKSEKVTSKSEASGKKLLPKPKGIVIKERIHTEETLARSQPQIDPRSKGKEKVGEPIKPYVPPEEEEITGGKDDLALTSRKVLKTTSDMAQVVQSQEIVSSDIQKKQITSDSAQVNLISENRSKTLLPGFTKAKQTQSLKTTPSGFEARVVTGKEARDKTGLGSADERRVHNTTDDPTSLSEPGIGATPERLNQLESVQMVYHTYLKEYIMLYFMTDGRVYHIRQNAIPLKYFEELEHRQKRLYSVKSDSRYVPKYRDHNGDIVDMKPNTAQIRTYLGIKGLEFNLESDKAYVIRLDQELRKAKIDDLRAAIFQTGEDTAELKCVKRRMIDELRYAEKCLLKLLSEVEIGKTLRTYKSKVVLLRSSGETDNSVLGEITPALPKRKVKLPASLCSPFLRHFGSSSKQTMEPKDIDSLKGISPLDDTIGILPHMELTVDFYNWLDKGLLLTNTKNFYSKEDNTISPPFKLGMQLISEKTWFHTLEYGSSNLSKSHVEVFLYYLRKLSKFRLDFKTKISGKKDILDMINGYSLPFDMSWSSVDMVLIPIWLSDQKHRLLAVLKFSERRIIVPNTLSRKGLSVILKNALQQLSTLLPYFLLSTNFYERTDIYFSAKCYAEKEKTDRFRVVMQHGYPLVSSMDSGVLMVSIAEYLVRHIEFPDISFDISTHRTRLAYLFYSYGMAKEIHKYESEPEYLDQCDGDEDGQGISKRTQGRNIATRKRNMVKKSPKSKKGKRS
ncbi:hypothetical protein AgCh_033278 [Apium graveolens]